MLLPEEQNALQALLMGCNHQLIFSNSIHIYILCILPGKKVAPSPTLQCSSLWKGSLWVVLDYGHQLYIYIWIYTYIKSKVSNRSRGWPEGSFSIVTTPRCRGGRYSFPWIVHFTLDPSHIMLRVKQGSIKYHFLSLWYDLI